LNPVTPMIASFKLERLTEQFEWGSQKTPRRVSAVFRVSEDRPATQGNRRACGDKASLLIRLVNGMIERWALLSSGFRTVAKWRYPLRPGVAGT
jgi:hypothetical protein